jgi:hypothetical protein
VMSKHQVSIGSTTRQYTKSMAGDLSDMVIDDHASPL